MSGEMISTLLLLTLVGRVYLREECEGSPCQPSLGDLLVGRAAQLSATSTCGLKGPQNYCILGYLEDEQKCFTCDSRNTYNHYNNRNSHKIENIITVFETERKMRWWQSENGVHHVSIQLDLEALFQFSHLVLTFKSFRPAAMLVERSKDFGRTWKVFRYFSADCAYDFPGISEGQAKSIDDLICDKRYSGAEPSTDGEVVLKALDPNFHISDPYDPIIQELITLTNLRVNFTRLLTLGDDLLGRKRRNPQEKYYYALYEMLVRGSCFCNGHASQCTATEADFSTASMVQGRCVCEHNTMGTNCEMCQPFYNDAPWRPAWGTEIHECKRCNCNGHSERCHFDMERYTATGQVSGGVCEACRNNRVGPQCEQCRPGFYLDPQRSVEDPQACLSCSCDTAGSVIERPCNPVSGQCFCKKNVEGEQCDRCKTGFYGLDLQDPNGCKACMCNILGIVHTSPCNLYTGQCNCEPLAVGPACDQCVTGYWGLGNSLYYCSPCDCDIGGSFGNTCSSESGQCLCRANMIGRKCDGPAPGFFLAPLDFYVYEAENAEPISSKCSSYAARPTTQAPYQNSRPYCSSQRKPAYEFSTLPPTTVPNNLPETPAPDDNDMPSCAQYFKSRGYTVFFKDGKFVVVNPKSRQKRRQIQRSITLHPGLAHQIILRAHTPGESGTWTGPGFVRVQDGAGLRFIVTNIPLSLKYHLVIRYELQSTDDWTAIIKFVSLGSTDEKCSYDPSEKTATLRSTNKAAVLDHVVCLSFGVRYYVDIKFERRSHPDPYCSQHILIDSIGLIPKMESIPNFCSNAEQSKYQKYGCMEDITQAGEHITSKVCEKLVASMSAYIHNGAIECKCNPQGSLSSSCSKFDGQCICKPNVIGRCCDTCAPLSYGFGSSGCSACSCDPDGSTDAYCDYQSGQCPCRAYVTGKYCDRCLPGYYAFPNCRPCECNNLAHYCHPVTGTCLNCRQNSTGFHCERCIEGFVGDPATQDSCKPCKCPDILGSGRFFAHTCSKDSNSLTPVCQCHTGHQGLYCDKCSPGFYADLTLPGARCKECFCNNNIDLSDSEACDAVTGECLRCQHNTFGPRCQRCKPGYYGFALQQNCKECSCERLGTLITKCPEDGLCLCDHVTGQCPCRARVMGDRCDQCEDGYWNLSVGCEACNCNLEHSVNNLCNKITGHCPCEPGYGGIHCDKCAANHFGNPKMRCISCDCDMQGSIYPGCDPDTGDCLCRPGVVGYFCDTCAPGHEPDFPACNPCHPCYQLWELNVEKVSQAAKAMLSLIPNIREKQQLTEFQLEEKIQKHHQKLRNLIIHRDPDDLLGIENLLNLIRNTTEKLDTNNIIVDPSNLLNSEMDYIQHEFIRLLEELSKMAKDAQKLDYISLNDMLNRIRKLHSDFLKNEARVNGVKQILGSSRQTRQETVKELNSCQKRPLDVLEKKTRGLSVTSLNKEICGAPGDVECKKAQCGGALCEVCGGPSCTGSLPITQNTLDQAELTEAGIGILLQDLTEAETKIKKVRNMNKEVKDKTINMKNKIFDSKAKFEKDKNLTKEIIQQVAEYLREDRMEPDDIEKVASAVLKIKLPTSPEEISNMIQEIQRMLGNVTHFNEDLKQLEKHARSAQDLKEKAIKIQIRANVTDVTEIEDILRETTQLHGEIKEKLNETEMNTNITTDIINKGITKLSMIEDVLNTSTPLQGEIETLKNKTQINRAQAVEAKAVADSALNCSADAHKDLHEVEQQLKKLQNNTQTPDEEINNYLRNITIEAMNMVKDIENKMKLIDGLEKQIKDAVERKANQIRILEKLSTEAADLLNNITQSVGYYLICPA